uniref:Uncharacterized protein n=1 Tax=viral metagenome TaxID=1070528 RepID=A0A6C0D1I7_9ZZZZ
MSTYSQYSQNLGQTYSFYSPTDISGIIFEFTAINVSSRTNVAPSFEYNAAAGYTNVSAIAMINVPASSLNNLFYFQGYDFAANSTISPEMYGINASFKFNYTYSNASLTYGAINKAPNVSPQLKADYVNYLAYAITGGYNLADIFSNELSLIQGVVNMDTSFNNLINASISNLVNTPTANSSVINLNNSSIYFDTSSNQTLYIQSAKTLLDGFLSIANTPRGELFYTDIQNQALLPININASVAPFVGYYTIPFRAGDILSIRLVYVPFNGNASSIIGDNLLYNRSYKIMLRCV